MENLTNFICLPITLITKQKQVLLQQNQSSTSSSSSPPQLQIELSCTTTHKFFNIVGEPRNFHIQYDVKDSPISCCIYFHSQTFRQTINNLLSDWKIPSYFHTMIIKPIISRVFEILCNLPSSTGRCLTTTLLCVDINVFKICASDLRLFGLAVFREYSELEEIIRLGMKPASPKMVESLKKKKIMCSVDDDNDDGQWRSQDVWLGSDCSCGICLEDFPAESEVSCMPCSHMFHDECIKKWLYRSHYCPLCRFQLPTDDHLFGRRWKLVKDLAHVIQLAGYFE